MSARCAARGARCVGTGSSRRASGRRPRATIPMPRATTGRSPRSSRPSRPVEGTARGRVRPVRDEPVLADQRTRYLTRLLGAPSSWHVYVPRTDPFYPLGVQPDGTITVRPESFGCELNAFADLSSSSTAMGAAASRRTATPPPSAAHPVPEVEGWEPATVTPQEASVGLQHRDLSATISAVPWS